jgi:hypothetical protein
MRFDGIRPGVNLLIGKREQSVTVSERQVDQGYALEGTDY